MKTKFLLPALALIFTTGISFAKGNLNAHPDNDYIFRNDDWEPIDEVECNPQKGDCLAYSAPKMRPIPSMIQKVYLIPETTIGR